MTKKNARVVCLVPSWTETLLEAGVNVVGRTRYCIHPNHLIKTIAIVGGTKDFSPSLLHDLKPDYVVVDRQENTAEMAQEMEALGFTLLISDVTNIASFISACRYFRTVLMAEKLIEFAERYIGLGTISEKKFFANCTLKGSLETLDLHLNFEYVIWKKPFMVVGRNTFIGDVLRKAGIMLKHQENYPVVTESELNTAICLFSSEPYPFLKKFSEIEALGIRRVVVDGEKISWFGVRNLKFLESSQKEPS